MAKTKVGQFWLDTVVSGPYSETGLGFAPKAVIFFSDSAEFSGNLDHAIQMVGAATSSGQRWCLASMSTDNVWEPISTSYITISKCIVCLDSGGSITDEADLVSLDADGFTINQTIATIGPRIRYWAIGGDGITNAICGSFNIDTGLGVGGTQAVTGVGFQPDGMLFANCRAITSGFESGASPNHRANFHVGFAASDGATIQSRGVRHYKPHDDASARDNALRTNKNMQTHNVFGVTMETSVQSFDTDGFTLLSSAIADEANLVCYLALKGDEESTFRVGSFSTPTSAGNQDITGLGVAPAGVMLLGGWGSTTVGNQASTYGFYDGAINAGYGISTTRGVAAATDTARRSSSTKSVNWLDSPSTLSADASVTGTGPDGFTLNWSTADGIARDMAYFAVGPPEDGCLFGISIINPDSTSASIVNGRVREAYDGYWQWGHIPENQKHAALKFIWTGTDGLYKIDAKGRFSNPGGGRTWSVGKVHIIISVNGQPWIPKEYSYKAYAAFDTDATWIAYPGFPGDGIYTFDNTIDNSDYGKAPWVPLQTGDIVEVFIISNSETGPATNQFLPFDLEKVCFILDTTAPATTHCTGTFRWPADPLGDVWGSPNGWGGQKLVPDEIWTYLGITPYDEAEFPWGINWLDHDLAPLPDGTVYVINHDARNAGAGTPDTRYHYVVIKKYDPITDDWTQLYTINIRPPTDRYQAEAVSCKYDGTYVYFVWWEMFAPAGPYPNTGTGQWRWHCKRLDPTDDSIISLGSGQAQNTSLQTNFSYSTLANSIACVGNGGDIYVGAIEYGDNETYGGEQRLIIWRWNGSTWINLNLPDPTVIGPNNTGDPSSPVLFDVIGENGYYDVLSTMVCARHDEGPVTNGITLSYYYYWAEGRPGSYVGWESLVTIAYTVGSGWGPEIRTGAANIEETPTYRRSGQIEEVGYKYGFWGQWLDLDIMWHPKLEKLVLCADLYFYPQGMWDVFKMNDAGTNWEVYSALAPGEVTGTWNQSRNTADIGPDGEVYAARWGQTLNSIWEPKLFKSSKGFVADFSIAGVPGMGERSWEGANGPYLWNSYLYGTAHYRIRIINNSAYILVNAFTEAYDADNANYTDTGFADGIYVFKLDYLPCFGVIDLSKIRYRAWNEAVV